MTGNNFLLDTNIISALFKGNVSVTENILNAQSIFIPVISVGELHYGAALSANSLKYIKDIDELIASYPILHVDEDTCKHYGLIKAALRRKGKPIPENDIWIAAITLQHNLTLVTRDGHFNEVDGLSIEEW